MMASSEESTMAANKAAGSGAISPSVALVRFALIGLFSSRAETTGGADQPSGPQGSIRCFGEFLARRVPCSCLGQNAGAKREESRTPSAMSSLLDSEPVIRSFDCELGIADQPHIRGGVCARRKPVAFKVGKLLGNSRLTDPKGNPLRRRSLDTSQ